MAPLSNVVIIHTDDTGRYISPYGYGIDTPNLQSLADDGILFRETHCAGPTCSPSRGALLTGSSPHSNGLIGLAHRGFEMDSYERHLSNFLSEQGFETVLVGQQHEVARDVSESNPEKSILGYDRVLPVDESAIDDVPIDHDHTHHDFSATAAATEYIREVGSMKDPDPFFLSIGFDNTHKPLPLDQNLVDPDSVAPPDPLPDVPPIRDEMAGYHAAIRSVDTCVGDIITTLELTGLLDKTLVIFTTDHGIPFPLMKCNLNDSGTGVSLIARFPERADVTQPATIDELVSQLDLFPTLCEYLGLDIPEWVEGYSLLPLLRGEVDSIRDEVFSEVTYHAAYEPKRSIRTERYRYVQRFDEEYDRHVAPNTDAGPSKEFFIDLGYFDREPPKEALYDLYIDPNESHNLIDDPEYESVRKDLRDRLWDWMERTEDPLLEGPVSKPDGAVADRRDALHPDAGEFEDPHAR
ncbi:sulfatase family protein [Halomicrobium urmianum]|uniref:sulfatase family protein n=1 Tax=Halomicrobium urmianum TaxID=1586233 RepID=UPI001CD9BED2|nr:sulfatase [Halomicrobium urmianum]